MIPDEYSERLRDGTTWVLKIQHVNFISQHDFTPIKIGNDKNRLKIKCLP